ncbi:bifunctional DNA-formamidopyrimidine glycosylase/DNA-(apurinic or apyrimidinic site) lyase [Marinimicrobium sp. ARAG 43.8]|uniref:bifunctional DNA-formamidopyrimidine glycosylase/DNA-(apurinic or apyrimidinic site) lyase n=1 Tax=Marinimicrobium sp. ARAG 43.8 TaxID=3418719 RepID=UPI003CE74EAA
MPELPEVETTRRGIAPHILHRKVTAVHVRQPSLRWPVPDALASAIRGRQLRSVERRGKYLLLGFTNGTALIHLGMSGSLRIVKPEEPPRFHDHFDIVFGTTVLRYCDPRRFGCLLWVEGDPLAHKLLSSLGPEPLDESAFTAEYLFARSRKRLVPVKQFLMDSKVVVGVGNIYANEALFMAGIKPIRKTGTLTRGQSERLVEQVRFVLQRSIEQGGTTLRDFVGGDGQPGYFKQQLLAYGRGAQPCRQCGKHLKEIRMSGRSTVYCVDCQR